MREPAWHRRKQEQRQRARLIIDTANSLLKAGQELEKKLEEKLLRAAEVVKDHHAFTFPKAVLSWLKDKMSNGDAKDGGWQTVGGRRISGRLALKYCGG